MQTTFTVLSLNEIRLLKQITIISEIGRNRGSSIGYILYEREFSNQYKCKEIPEKEKDATYFFEYPQQSIFPVDAIDQLILQAVKNSNPQSTVWNSTIFSSMDLERLQRLQSHPHVNSFINLSPFLAHLNVENFVGGTFNYLNIPLKIYQDYTLESIQNLAFFGNYYLNDKLILQEIEKVKFL